MTSGISPMTVGRSGSKGSLTRVLQVDRHKGYAFHLDSPPDRGRARIRGRITWQRIHSLSNCDGSAMTSEGT